MKAIVLRTRTNPKEIGQMKAVCVHISAYACVSVCCDIQQGEFGWIFYFHFRKFRTINKTNSRVLGQPLMAVTYMERCSLFYKDLLYWFLVTLWLNKSCMILHTLTPNSWFRVLWTTLSSAGPLETQHEQQAAMECLCWWLLEECWVI